MKYKLIVSQIKGNKISTVNIIEGTEPIQVLRELAKCYKDAGAKTCDNPRVMACKYWVCLDRDGGHVQKFRFTCSGTASGTGIINYVYEYEFSGCGLD